MKQKRNSRAMLVILLILMISITIPMQNVSAASLPHPFGFEGVPAPGQYSDSRITTQKEYGMANVSSSNVRTGTRSYNIGYDAVVRSGAWFNISTGGSYLTNFTICFRSNVPFSASRIYFTLLNRTIAQRNGLIFGTSPLTANEYKKGYLAIMFCYSASTWFHTDESGNNDAFGSTGAWNTYHKIYMSFENDIGDMKYGVDNSINGWDVQYEGVSCNGTAINNGYIADIIYIYTEAPWSTTYLDDAIITISDSYSGEIPQVGCLDTTGLTQVGYFGSTQTDSPSQHISKTYNVMVSTTIMGVELQVNRNQILSAGDLGNYDCSINGLSIGMPSCSVLLDAYGILQWETNYTFENNVVTFDFTHTKKTDNWYWQVGCGATSSIDLDGDGEIWYMQSRTETTYEWDWFWIFPYQKPIYDAFATTINRDMAVRWWCTGFAPPSGIEYNYTDDLGLSKYEYRNATGYIYNLSKGYYYVFGGYLLNDPVASYEVELEIDGASYTGLNWPHICNYPSSTFGIAPLEAGIYEFILTKDSVEETRVRAYVTGTLGDYVIRTDPPITDQYSPYNVLWRYYEPHGHPGYIGMTTIIEDALKKYADSEVSLPAITANTTGSILHYSVSPGAEWWGLYVYANSRHTLYAKTTHHIRIPSIYENTISPLFPVVEFGADEILQGTHMLPGGDVRVYVNNQFIGNVGDSQNFQISYKTTQPGVHVATLVASMNNSTQTLATCTFNVKAGISPPEKESEWEWLDLIPALYIPLIGIGVIAMFALLPLIVVTSLQKKVNIQIHIPEKVMMIISIFTGFAGYILTILWGIFEWWTIFMVLFAFILILAILYYSGHRDGGGGGGTQ